MGYLTLIDYLDSNNVEYCDNVNLADLVSIRVGGSGDLVVYPKSTSELIDIVRLLKGKRYFLLGNGTNCYFTSQRYNGVIIVTKLLNNAVCKDNFIYAECGTSLSKLCNLALNHSLSGLEFAFGIPATLGGAVYMNAAAYGSMISSVINTSLVYDSLKDETVTLTNNEHNFSKKSSVLHGGRFIHLSSELFLNFGEKDVIFKKMQACLKSRNATQPSSLPNAGSVFINPCVGFASKMIDECGLKGFRIGDAQVSTKHAGFIVNLGSASSDDINNLIAIIKKRVFDKFNINLNEEIIYVE